MSESSKNSKAYILNRTLDLWVTGLLSIVLISVIMLVGPTKSDSISLADAFIIMTAINGAHFMASYRMLYYSREDALRYPQASIYMPVALFIYCVVAIWQSEHEPFMVSALLVAASIYLALHYTGQVWGMMASLAFVDGIKFSKQQRDSFKLSLKFLMLWQICWSLRILDPKPEWLVNALETFDIVPYILIALAAFNGLKGIFSMQKELNTYKLRMLVPYIALYFWYALLSVNALALPLIQFFHAIQYLIFPLRVELNRHSMRSEAGKTISRHMFEYLFVMLLMGALAFVLIPDYLEGVGSGYAAAAAVFISAINIHHFYIDGYIWKISQPVVKNELFAHIQKPQ